MANTDTPMGFKPVKYIDGSPYDGKARVCKVETSETDRIGLYDLVTPAGSGDATGMYMSVTRSAAGEEDILGSVIGFGDTPYMAFDPDDLNMRYGTGSTAYYVWVADDPDLLFLCQDDASATLTYANVGENADIAVANCSTTTGLSAMELDASDATGGVANMRIEGFYNDPSNEVGSTHAKLLVRINEHAYKNTTGA